MERNTFNAERENKPFPKGLRMLCPATDRHSQALLANTLGVKRQTVNAWTLGKSQPDIDTIIRIAQLFNVTTDWLLGMPNASKEISADKYQVMKTTGLSEKAVDQLVSACAENVKAVDSLLSTDDFTTAMSDLDEAIDLSYNWTSDSYYLLPFPSMGDEFDPKFKDLASEIKNILRRPNGSLAIVGIAEWVRHLISTAFDEIERQVTDSVLNNIWSLMEHSQDEKEGEINGNDHSSEE